MPVSHELKTGKYFKRSAVQIYEQNIIPCNNVFKNVSDTVSTAPYLDTLAQLRKPLIDVPSRGGKNVLKKRCRAKYISNKIALSLADLESDLQKSYYNTYHCVDTLVQSGKKVTSKYCNNRWCLVCNRIRIAKLINGYKNVLAELPEKRFVTLTVPNVPAEMLRETLLDMGKRFKNVTETFRKRKTPIIGIRKIEVTYNVIRNDFHPHYHLIVSGEQVAKNVIVEWLKRFPEATFDAQDERPADDNSVMELFKYFTKMVTNKNVFVKALDTIFRSMYKMRTFQPMGIRKNVSEDIEELRAEIYADLEEREQIWTWYENDWVDCETGETLTGYVPSANVERLVKSIKFVNTS